MDDENREWNQAYIASEIPAFTGFDPDEMKRQKPIAIVAAVVLVVMVGVPIVRAML